MSEKEKLKEVVCTKFKYHKYAESGIFIDSEKAKMKCACGHTKEVKVK